MEHIPTSKMRDTLYKASPHKFLEDNIVWHLKLDGFTKLTCKKNNFLENISILDYKKSKQNIVAFWKNS